MSMTMRSSDPQYLRPAELVARWCNTVTLSTLDNWRSQQRGPRWFKAGGRVLYPINEVVQFEQRNMRGFSNTVSKEK